MSTAYELAQLAMPGTIGFYKFAESSGTTSTDTQGTVGNMTYSGTGIGYSQASLLPGDPTNTSLLFDGTAGRATRASEAALDITAQISFGCWIQPTDVSATSDRSLIYKPNFNWGMMIRGNTVAPGTIKGEFKTSATSPSYTLVAGGTYHVVGTYDGVTQRVVVNGVPVATTSASGAMSTGATSFEVGSWLNTVHYKGLIQHVALANQGWSLAAIQNLYVTGATPATPVAGQAYVYPFSTVVLPANPNRTRVTFTNCSDWPIDLSLGATAPTAAGVRLQVNGDPWSVSGYTGQVAAIHGAFMGAKLLAIEEET